MNQIYTYMFTIFFHFQSTMKIIKRGPVYATTTCNHGDALLKYGAGPSRVKTDHKLPLVQFNYFKYYNF